MPDVTPGSFPLVTVVIPTYNGGDWLLDAIASCLNQLPIIPEVIVVDDASSDDTPQRVAACFPQVRLYKQSVNSGSGAHGRNLGLQKATGRYVKFLDHDDLLEPGALSKEVEAADRHLADMVMCCWGDVRTDQLGQIVDSSRRVFAPPEPDRLIEAILIGERVPYTAGVLYRRTYIADQHWDARLTINDDFDWFCRNTLRGGKIIRLDHVSYFWRLHSSSIQGSQSRNKKSFVESALIHNYVYRYIGLALGQQQSLTTDFSLLLVRQLYRDLRVLARFDPVLCRATLRSINDYYPGFKPDDQLEGNAFIRWVIRRFGLHVFLASYRFFMAIPDSFRFRGGKIRYFARSTSPAISF